MENNTNQNIDSLEMIYFRVTDLWQRLCEKHTTLLNITFDEYALLLESNLDDLESKSQEKDGVQNEITALEKVREQVIEELNSILVKKEMDPISSVSDLIMVMDIYEKKNNQKHLFRFNSLLIDLIEKIQEQNKKNQLFINKALLSLKQIREEVMGSKDYSTYNKRGSHTSHTTD
ncbi:MAG: flagellar biosynthesis/type III secretory pathway chaperone [Bacteriovoracaceae bacterium]|jgi:flagellar biosynthesis/type III secretory pathway chaperone